MVIGTYCTDSRKSNGSASVNRGHLHDGVFTTCVVIVTALVQHMIKPREWKCGARRDIGKKTSKGFSVRPIWLLENQSWITIKIK